MTNPSASSPETTSETTVVPSAPAAPPEVPKDYREQLKQDFKQMMGTIDLDELQKYYLTARWLDQVLWIESRASQSRDWHYRLRVTAIIGSVLVPILVGINPGLEGGQKDAWRYLTTGISAVVAGATAIEQFFNYGERWRNYRRAAEELKSQGWQYFELCGPYNNTTHRQGFSKFHEAVEDIIRRDVAIYSTQVIQGQQPDGRPDRKDNND
ncbi:DUF4231 domain-containing protein [Alkalinema pantanalense CENA528]|uniref:DUF4231 domain-containing protein n=1 Tax=Alkalinema pantanalense TaxID=1620705 RepID=UPI003D6F2AED